MLNDVKEFISNGDKKEVIILNFSHFMDFKKFDTEDSHFDKEDFNELESKIANKLNGYLVRDKQNFINSKISDLTSGSSKVIVLFDHEDYDGSKGIYSLEYLNLYDNYSNTTDYATMKADQFSKMHDNSSSKYFLLSWLLTQNEDQAIGCMIPLNAGKPFGYDCYSIDSLSKKANRNLSEILKNSNQDNGYPNVIYTDFSSNKETEISLQLNAKR